VPVPRRVGRGERRPPAGAGGVRGEDADREGRVLHATREDGVDGVVEGNPLHLDVGLLVGALEGLLGRGEPAGEVDADDLVVPARARGELGEDLPLDVEEPGRQLPLAQSHRVPVLPDDQDAVLLIERQDGDGARVVRVLADDRRPVVVERVAADVPDPPLEDELTLGHLDGEGHILQGGLRHDVPLGGHRGPVGRRDDAAQASTSSSKSWLAW
jgi:hypothetical protein